MVLSNGHSSISFIILTPMVIAIIVLLTGQIITRTSFGENKNFTSPTEVLHASISNLSSISNYTIAPSVRITYPPYPPTITTGKLIIEGTANETQGGIQNVTAMAHVFPFKGDFPIKLQASPTAPKNWARWVVPLVINSTGTYRVVITARDNAGNQNETETTINAALPGKTVSLTTGTTQPRIAFVRSTFTEAAYQEHGFYTFYSKYKFPPFGTNITTDLDMLTVKTPVSVAEELQNQSSLQHLSNLTALIPSDPDQQKFWNPLIDDAIRIVPNGIVTVIRDEDVNDGQIFGPNGHICEKTDYAE